VFQVEGFYRDAVTNELLPDRRQTLADRRSGESEEQEAEWAEKRSGQDRRQAVTALNILILSAGSLTYGLVVDELDDTEEIVVKPLGRHLKGIRSFAGATIMGDGRVAPILDVVGLAAHAQLFSKDDDVRRAAHSRTTREDRSTGQDMEKLLIFNHTPDEYFAVPIPLVARIERIRVESIESSMGRLSIQYKGRSLRLLRLDRHLPVAPFPDIEEAYVIVFDMGDHEIGLMALSLSDEKLVHLDMDLHTHRRPGVMGSQIIDGKTVLLVDIFELVDLDRPEGEPSLSVARARSSGKKKILLVEDSPFFRDKVSGYLKQAGFEVLLAEDGRQGLERLNKHKVDLVLTDMEMPNMNGYDMVREIRSTPELVNLKVMALSSLAGHDDIQRGLAAGVDQYMIKLDRERLLATLTEHFATAQGC